MGGGGVAPFCLQDANPVEANFSGNRSTLDVDVMKFIFNNDY